MNKFLNKKKKRNENHKETKYNHINILENIFTKSKKLYDDKVNIIYINYFYSLFLNYVYFPLIYKNYNKYLNQIKNLLTIRFNKTTRKRFYLKSIAKIIYPNKTTFYIFIHVI